MTGRVSRIATAALLATVAILMSGCSFAGPQPADTATGPATPTPTPTASVVTGLPYAPASPAGTSGHLLDLYLPAPSGRPAPVVLWTGGSAWRADDGGKTALMLAEVLNPEGYAVVGVNVRASSQARFPAQRNDLAAAIRYLTSVGARYGLDTDRMVVSGDSSGGWAALQAGLTGQPVKAVVAFYPPTDFATFDAQLAACRPGGAGSIMCMTNRGSPIAAELGCVMPACPPARLADASPVTHVDAGDPPVLLFHGMRDDVVPYQQSVELANRVTRAGGSAQLVLASQLGHATAQDILDDAGDRSLLLDFLADAVR
ncbi:alpha/beta hydrolase [Leifsonia sp. F6_8S_P_1B]|uniref:Alpha/beta hydrolase n=1 Tax=Leifsonia williamsii TaxID=3035919 RepID=A0ABT8KGD5_9MICO|nr:alpha/beta hydrolase [Leifsonia williamsii]MDN4615404.1 alpha/beta hydrolase [Leifsonia williamsii]